MGGARDVGADVSGGRDQVHVTGGDDGGSLAGDAGDEWARGEGWEGGEREGPRMTTKASGDAVEEGANRGTERGGGGGWGDGGHEAMAKLQKKMDEDWEELLQVRLCLVSLIWALFCVSYVRALQVLLYVFFPFAIVRVICLCFVCAPGVFHRCGQLLQVVLCLSLLYVYAYAYVHMCVFMNGNEFAH